MQRFEATAAAKREAMCMTNVIATGARSGLWAALLLVRKSVDVSNGSLATAVSRRLTSS